MRLRALGWRYAYDALVRYFACVCFGKRSITGRLWLDSEPQRRRAALESMSQQRALGLQPQAIAAALPENVWDPLRHEDADPFWREIEPFFSPITVESLSYMRESDTMNDGPDTDLLVPTADAENVVPNGEPGESAPETRQPERRRRRPEATSSGGSAVDHSEKWTVERLLRARLNSYPFFQRVAAAFVELPSTGDAPASAMRNKGSGPEDLFWSGPADSQLLDEYHRILEIRVTNELQSIGLIDDTDADELQSEMRLLQWQLRNAKARNRSIRSWSYSDWNRVLKAQGKARELEQGNQNLQILYLERAIRKCRRNRRMRQRFERVLKLLFPSHRIGNLNLQRRTEPAAGAHTEQKTLPAGAENSP